MLWVFSVLSSVCWLQSGSTLYNLYFFNKDAQKYKKTNKQNPSAAQHVVNVTVLFSYLSPEYSELNDSFVLLFSHSLGGQLQTTNQIDLSPLLDFGVFAKRINRHKDTDDQYPKCFKMDSVW